MSRTAAPPPPSEVEPAAPRRARRARRARRVCGRLPSGLRAELLVVAFFIGVGVLATWPLALHLGSRTPADIGDPLENIWIFDWAAHALAHSRRDLFDANMFSPEPLTLAYAENMLGLSVPVAPLILLTGNPVLATNVALIAVYALGGWSTYLLARDLTGRRDPAVLAGLLFTMSPYRLSQPAHLHVLAVYLTPLVLLLALRLRRAPSLRLATLLGLAVGLQAWTSLTGTLVTAVALGAWLLWLLARERRAAARALGYTCAGLVLAGLVAFPVSLPYLRLREIHPEFEHPEDSLLEFSATPSSYLSTPDRPMLVSDGPYEGLRARFTDERGAWEKRLFPGLVLSIAFLASLAGLVWVGLLRALPSRRRAPPDPDSDGAPRWVVEASFFLVLGAVAFVVSLGPNWGARAGGATLPFALLADMLPGNLSRVPARIGTLVPLAMAIVVALAIAAAAQRSRRVALAVAFPLALLELAPASWQLPAPPARTAAHEAVASTSGMMLGLPTTEILPDGSADSSTVPRDTIHLYLSTAHHRPILNGYGAFHPERYWHMVRAVQSFPSPDSMTWLRSRGTSTVVVQTGYLEGTPWADVVARLRTWPGVREIAHGRGVRVYDIEAADLDPRRATDSSNTP